MLDNGDMNSQHILVIDDESSIRDLLHDVLRKRGFEVSRSATAQEALELAQQHRFDLIILDVALEDADGLDLLATFKQLDPKRPVLILTGLGYDDELAQEALTRDAAGCLSKTAPMDQLTAEVQRILNAAHT
jgi:two-component system, NtrC family, response regulator GlrR